MIKQSDVKKFKSFLSGKEIEVGIWLSNTANIFRPGDEVEIFYGEENCDAYRAKITRQKRALPPGNSDQAMVMLGLQKR